MTVILSPIILRERESNTLIPLGVYAPETYELLIQPNGNSLLSSLLVLSLDPGASVTVNYWQTTSGLETEERTDLTGHGTISVTDTAANQTLVTRIHNKVYAEIIVAGGNARFGIYGSVVSSFATDLEAALKLDQQPVDIQRDKGIPISVYDTVNGKWVFLRTDASGALITSATLSPTFANTNVAGVASIAPSGVSDVVTYTVPSGKSFSLMSARASATGDFKHELLLDGTTISSALNSWMDRDVELSTPINIASGQVLKIKSTSRTVFGTTNSVEAYIIGKEV